LFKKSKIKSYLELRKSYLKNDLYHHVPDYPEILGLFFLN